ncbi:MAG: glycosyltransferase [Symploca sp. SIO2B6]|nr:glycosyltransferase [Symploca sp. SIO2B6]
MENAITLSRTASFSSHIYTHLKDRALIFRVLITINLLFGAWYVQWRIFNSINMDALWISIPLLLAEIYSYVGGALFLLGLWNPIVRRATALNQLVPAFPSEQYPRVDVFITCYNEPANMVEETARAALAMDYPSTHLCVYVLDDGDSAKMREMTERLCLEDLRSPQLQQVAESINTKRLQLETQLEQLANLDTTIEQITDSLKTFSLQVKTDYNALPKVLEWFEQLKPNIVPQTVWLECQTILGEGFDNAICHAHKNLPKTTPITLDVIILPQSIVIKIFDRGPWFDLEGAILNRSTVDNDAERGRGLGIMEEVTDYLSYIPTNDGRNCLLLMREYQPIVSESSTQANSSDLTIGLLQGLQEIVLVGESKIKSLEDYLEQKKKALKREVQEQEVALSELARCRYIARPKPKDRPHHAKAGNINYAIFSGETQGGLILTLDADHIPKPHFLQRVTPYFFTYNVHSGAYEGNLLAFVQTPQAFYNLPPGDPFGHEAHLFYGPIQQGKDGMNSAFYTGTNAILRREALVSVGLQNFADEFAANEQRLDEFELVGGVSSASITEDMNTAMRLHAAGWKSAYHHEVLAVGLAPDDLSSTLKQKLRWAQGTIQVMVTENPLTKPGLSLGQRLQYFQTMYSYFSGFFVAIFIACPILFFFTDIIPVRSYGIDFAIHFIPVFILNRLTFMMVGWGVPMKELWRSEQYAIALFPLFIKAVWSVLTGMNLKFQVTPKHRQSGIYLGLVWPQISIVILTILGILWCIYRYIKGEIDTPSLYIINAGWALYNVSLIWVIIRAAMWQPKT